MSSTAILSLENKAKFDEYVKRKGLNLVHFSASWSPSSTQMDEILSELQKEYSNAFTAAAIDAEGVPEASLEHKITAAPTIVLFKDGKFVDRLDGFHPTALRNLIVRHSFEETPAVATTTKLSATKESLEDRLKKLINKSRLTLFMKGNAKQPRCGFSRQIIQLLDEVKADYWTFDILGDEEVRQGLKTFSDWPTYPQVYLDGEFLGGLDVIREELKDADFVAKLPKTN